MSTTLDLLAAILMLIGAGFVLVAAIGVARLPDIFVRMHAATKAGVLGVGLLLIGTAVSFGDTGVWTRVIPALVFLVVTTPIAAHALARAAYASGAPLWRGTIVDHLSAAGDRGVAAFGRVGHPVPTETVPASEDDPMTILPFDEKKRVGRQVAATETRICRILVGLVPDEEGRAAVHHAIALARETDAELVGMSIVDVPAIRRVGPVPADGIGYARQLPDHRLHLARDQAAAAVTAFEAEAAKARVRYAVRHEEGERRRLMAGLARGVDLVVMPASGGEATASATDRLDELLDAGVRPILTAAGPRREIRHVLFACDGGLRSRETLRWFAQTRLWPEATVHVAGVGHETPETVAALEECVAYLRAHGYTVESSVVLSDGGVTADPLSGLGFVCDAVVIGDSGTGGLFRRLSASVARRLRDADCPVLIG